MAFTHVLVPTDFSDPSTHALRHAIAEAALQHAKVTLLHVLPSRAGPDVYYVTGAPEAGPQGGFDLITGGPPGGVSVIGIDGLAPGSQRGSPGAAP